MPVRPAITTYRLENKCQGTLCILLHLGLPLCQGLALLALAIVAETDGKNGGEGTSHLFGWVMVVLVTGYVLAALVAVLMKRGSRAKVCVSGDTQHTQPNAKEDMTE